MSLAVMAVVIGSAVMHATWSAIAFGFSDQVRGFTTLLLLTIPITLGMILLSPAVAARGVPWLVTSIAVHVAYTAALAFANGVSRFSELYPLSRGTAPVLVAVGVVLFPIAGVNALSASQLIALAVIVIGLLVVASAGRGRGRARPREQWSSSTVGIALGIGVLIATYTVIDGIGIRSADSLMSYAGWLGLGTSTGSLLLLAVRSGVQWPRQPAGEWRRGGVGALLSQGSYGSVIWAQAHGPLPLVAALRETSVLFAALIGIVIFRERAAGTRLGGAAVVVTGIALLRLRGSA